MTADDGEDATVDEDDVAETLDGLPVETAVETVVEDDPERDAEVVRAALDHVTEDGVVSAEAVEDAVGHTAKVVSTPETRVELTEMALDEARAAAEGVDDLDVVAARLDDYQARLDSLRDRLANVAETFQTVIEVDEQADSLYAVASGIHAVQREATAVQRDADELTTEIEEFETYVADPSVRVERLSADADAVGETLDDLEAGADGIAAAVDSDRSSQSGIDPGLAWFDATLRHRMVALLLDDLDNEAATLRTWAAREDASTDPIDDVEDRLADLRERHAALGERLDDFQEEEWQARFAQPLGALQTRFERAEPPVDWTDVYETLEEYRTIVE